MACGGAPRRNRLVRACPNQCLFMANAPKSAVFMHTQVPRNYAHETTRSRRCVAFDHRDGVRGCSACPMAHADVDGLAEARNSRDIDHPGAMQSQHHAVAHVATDWAQLTMDHQPGMTLRFAA
jgi:hypothetical protein